METIDRMLWVALALAAVGGCAPRPMHGDDVSAETHRRLAQRETAMAAAQRVKYDPKAHLISRGQMAGLPTPGDYNPTDYYRRSADDHAAHAREHLAAATRLERFEDIACTGLPGSERAACPILAPAGAVSDIENGVRVQPADWARVPSLLVRMRCHLAYARTRGYETAPDCPLYMQGAEINAAPDGRSIDLTARDAKTVEELRRRVREEASPAPVL